MGISEKQFQQMLQGTIHEGKYGTAPILPPQPTPETRTRETVRGVESKSPKPKQPTKTKSRSKAKTSRRTDHHDLVRMAIIVLVTRQLIRWSPAILFACVLLAGMLPNP